MSSITGFAKFDCNQPEILFKDTYVLERRKVTFTVKNTGNIALRFTTAFSTSSEACLAYLLEVAAFNVARAPSAQEKERPEKPDKKGRIEQQTVNSDDDSAPGVPSLPVPTVTRSEKSGKHASLPRGGAQAIQSATDSSTAKESQKRKRKASKDNASDTTQAQLQIVPSPRSAAGGTRSNNALANDFSLHSLYISTAVALKLSKN